MNKKSLNNLKRGEKNIRQEMKETEEKKHKKIKEAEKKTYKKTKEEPDENPDENQVEGRNAVLELLKSDKDINKIFISKGEKHRIN